MSHEGMSDHEAKLEQVLADYVRSAERGEPPDRQQLLSQYPELADDLQSFFRNRDAIQRLAEPIQEQAPTVGLDAVETEADGDRIRYFGDYELVEEIARGGMGVVYRARQVSLNRSVALKMILSGELASEDDVRRFRMEAEAAANLDHVSIVPIYEIGEHEGQHYFSMKLVDGSSLRDEMASVTSNVRGAMKLLSQVARAVHHAHQRGVLHRDLKPSNILIDAEGEPHVTDFGLAKRVEGDSDLTKSGAILGTPSYMAPEQATGQKLLSTAVDVYSLGAILYEMLTARAPFRGTSPVETLMQVMTREPDRPRTIHSSVDRDLETICLKCLAKEPGRRYDSAAALADDLEHWQRSEPIVARPISAWERGVKWARRSPAAAMLTVVSVVSLAAVLAGLTFGNVLIREAHHRTSQEQRKTQVAYEKLAREEQATRDTLLQLRHASYGRSLTLARIEWQNSNVGEALRLLNECPAKMRHWEWKYLSQLCRSEQQSLDCSSSGLRAITYRPDGEVLIAGGGSIGFGPSVGTQEVFRWNFRSGEPQPKLHERPPSGAITGLAWAPQSDFVAFSLWCMDDARDVVLTAGKTPEDRAGRVELRDPTTGRLLHSLKQHHSFVNGVAVSYDGKRVASASSDQTVNVWDAVTGERLFSLDGHHGQVMCVAFNPAGTLIATGSQGPLSNFSSGTPNDFGEVKLWNATDGTEQRALSGHELAVLSIAFSPDGDQLATAGRDRIVKIWEAATGRPVHTLFGHQDDVTGIAFSPNGLLIATASLDRTVRIWDAADGRPLSVLRGHTEPVTSVVFHPDSRHVASCGRDSEVKTWDVNALPEIVVARQRANEVREIEARPDGERIAAYVAVSGSLSHELRIIDGRDGQQLGTVPISNGYLSSMRIANGGKRLVTLSTGENLAVQVFDLSSEPPWTPGKAFTVRQYEKARSLQPLLDPALTEDGLLLATYSHPKQAVILVETDTGNQRWNVPHKAGQDIRLQFSPDQRLLFARTSDRLRIDDQLEWRVTAICAWEVGTGRSVFTITPQAPLDWQLAISPTGHQLVLPRKDHGVRLWDIEGRQAVRDLAVVAQHCREVRFSATGEKLVTVHQPENHLEMHVWDVASGNRITTLDDFAEGKPLGYYGGDVEFSPDDRRIFTCGDGTVKVWDSVEGTLLLTLRPAHSPMRLSQEGRRVIAAGPQGVIQIWTADIP